MARLPLAVTVVVFACVAVGQAEPIDNPAYSMWASSQAGAYVTYDMTMSYPAYQMEMTVRLRSTLKSLDAQQAVVVREAVMNPDGEQSHVMPPQEEVIPAKVEPEQVDPYFQSLDDEETKKGQEELTIAGKPVQCTWYEITGEREGESLTGRVWLSEQVPGGVVKLDGQTRGPQGDGAIRMTVREHGQSQPQ